MTVAAPFFYRWKLPLMMLWFAGMQTVKLPVLDQKFWELFTQLVCVAENMLPLGSHSLIVGKTLKNEGHCAGG